MHSHRPLISAVIVAVAIAACAGTAPPAGAQDKQAVSILADAVRVRGFTCEKPKNARREPKKSQPDEAVWLIDCGNATYRIRFAGDTGPDITPMAPN